MPVSPLAPTALVTGASHRIGRTIALFLAERGYALALHCNRSRAAAEACRRKSKTKAAGPPSCRATWRIMMT